MSDIQKTVKGLNSTLSVRLKQEAAQRLEEIMSARGLNKTDAIHYLIMGIPILQIGDVLDMAKEFCRIRQLVEKEEFAEVKEEVDKLCQCMFDLIAQVEEQRLLEHC